MKMFGLGILTTFFIAWVFIDIASNDDGRGYSEFHWAESILLFIIAFLFGVGVGKNIL